MADPRMNLLVLKTHQLARLKDFYAALGIDFVEEKHGHGPLHFAGRVGDIVLELYPMPADTGPADTTTRLGFAVPDLDATLRSLEAIGAEGGGGAGVTGSFHPSVNVPEVPSCRQDGSVSGKTSCRCETISEAATSFDGAENDAR